MRIYCLLKFVSQKTNHFTKNSITGDLKNNIIINPDDASALEFALRQKDENPNVYIEVVTMGPIHLKSKLEKLLEHTIDHVTLINDPLYIGSDSLATSKILSSYLKLQDYDLILTGSQTLDGDTGHVGPQIGEMLQLPQCSNIVEIPQITKKDAFIEIDTLTSRCTYQIDLPAVLSVSSESSYKLRFVKIGQNQKDTNNRLSIIRNDLLRHDTSTIGINGSSTQVKRTNTVKPQTKERRVLELNDESIEIIYNFMRLKGVIE